MTGRLAVTAELAATVGSPRRPCLYAVLAAAIVAELGSIASASCGDWLADPIHSMALSSPADDQPADTAPSKIRLANQDGGRAPCHGPLCRKVPDQPTPPVPVLVSVQLDKLGIVSSQSANEDVARQFGLSRESEAHPARGYPLLVEHPPRV